MYKLFIILLSTILWNTTPEQETINDLSEQANLLINNGDYEIAITVHLHILEKEEAIYGYNGLEIAYRCDIIARLYNSINNIEMAEYYLQRSIDIYQEILSNTKDNLKTALENIIEINIIDENWDNESINQSKLNLLKSDDSANGQAELNNQNFIKQDKAIEYVELAYTYLDRGLYLQSAENFSNALNLQTENLDLDYFSEFYISDSLQRNELIFAFQQLIEDKSDNTTGISRDYFFTLNDYHGQMPLLSVFGGKLTTHRALAENALKKIESYLGVRESWTHATKLPGGDFNLENRNNLMKKLGKEYDFLKDQTVERLFRNYGLDSWTILGSSKSFRDLGENFGSDLYAKEIEFLVKNEFVQSAEDVLWRRTKLGLVINEKKAHRIDTYIQRILQQDATRL